MKLTTNRNKRKTLPVVLTLVVVLAALGSMGIVSAQEVTVTQSTTQTTANPGDTVTLETTINATDVNGQGLQIQLPSGWLGTFTDVDGGSEKPALGEQANVLEVVWLSPGEYTVTYEVDVPADATAGDYTVDVEGSAIDPDTGDRIVTSTQTTITVEEPNEAPTADAGSDQTVNEGDSVSLDASDSSDPDGDSLSYSWTQTAGPDVTLDDATSATPTFTAPEVDADETLTFQVEVSDGEDTDTDEVNVTVQDVPEPNQDPTAAFTVDPASPEVGEDVTFDASNSEDPDGDIVSYEWTVDGETLTGETVTTSFDTEGDYEVTLTVTDDDGATNSTTQTVSVSEAPPDNEDPIADAGTDQTVNEGDSVSLDASDSSDPDGDSLSYSWTQTAGPDVTLDDATSATPTFTAPEVDAEETLTFQVEVSDGNGGTDTDEVNVVVLDVPETTSPSTAVSLSPESTEVVIGETETYDVVVENADGGVGAFTMTISLEDASVGSITDVTFADDPGLTDVSYAEDNSSVMITAALMDTEDTGSVSVASITVEGAAEGSSNVSVDVQALGTEAGESYTVTDENGASVSVIDLPPVGDFSNSPADLDDDGLYEDVNGDGVFDIVDVQALFANRNDPTIQNNPSKFDFNGDGEFNVVDVQALFNYLQEEN